MLRISDDPRVQGPERELRDGILLVLSGALVGCWLLRTGAGPACTLGFAIAIWGVVLTVDALRLRSRRR